MKYSDVLMADGENISNNSFKKYIDSCNNKKINQIYLDARCNEVKDKNLERIKEALYEVSNLCQYSPDTYRNLLYTLGGMSDDNLNKISKGNFSEYYKEYYKGTIGMPEDYDILCELLNVIYCDYKKIQTYDEYISCCNSMSLLFKREEKDLIILLKKLNQNLGDLISTYISIRNYELDTHDNKTLSYYIARSEIELQLLVTFMMYLNEYDYLYQIPGLLFNLIIGKLTEKQIIYIANFMRQKETNVFLAKDLLDGFYCNKDRFNLNETLNIIFDNTGKQLKLKKILK